MRLGSAWSGFQSSRKWSKSLVKRTQSSLNLPLLTVERAEQADMLLLATVATMAPDAASTSCLPAILEGSRLNGMQRPMSLTLSWRKRVPTC